MDSLSDRTENESPAKRLKLDLSGSNEGVLCNGGSFSNISTTTDSTIGHTEDVLLENNPVHPTYNGIATVPLHAEHESPTSTPGSTQQTPTHTDSLEMSQDSLELDDDNASTISHLSELSGLSDLSGEDWKPMAGSMVWIQKQMQNGVDPRMLLSELGADSDQIPQYVDDITLWKLIINMLAEPPRRHKLRHVNTLDDVVRLLKGAKNIVVLTGAGVSVSCGIPDFRSRDGIYLRLAVDFPDLPDPQAMFDINYFSQDPRPFYKFAKDIYPGNFQPSPCHRFIKLLETHRKLLRNYTQNIDTLEKVANIERVVECHGSFATATCTKCGHRVMADAIREIVLSQKIPLCEKCHGEGRTFINPDDIKGQREELSNLVLSGIMKPDIVFFGEGLPDVFHEAMAEDKNHCDLLLVIGSSLKVRPVALIPSSLPPEVPQILINREPLPHCHFDVELLGDCDVIVNHICQLMGSPWEEGVYNPDKLQETLHLLPVQDLEGELHKPLSVDRNKLTPFNNILEKSQNDTCDCQDSTKSSSLSLEKNVENSFAYITEENNSEKQMSIINRQFSIPEEEISDSMELKSVKERHMSIDSARDSGIGENSNFTDVEKFDVMDEINERTSDTQESSLSNKNQADTSDTSTSDLRGYWQPKIKKNMADRLPPNSFYLVPPSRYIFPGAEIFYDPNEKYTYFDDTSSSDSSESESENETDNPNNSFRD